MTVPSTYQGLWRRTGIRRSNGSTDTTTQVWWFQAARFHIDLRIPIDRPDPASRTHIVKYLPQQLARFGAQTGFAGTTVVDGNHCEWQPEIAFPWVSDVTDAGWMRFDSDDALHEAGVDGSYREDWWREAAGPVAASRAVLDDGRIQYEIRCGEFLARATGKPHKAADITVWRRTPAGLWRVIASTTAARENVTVESP
jgi:hypothetical protein